MRYLLLGAGLQGTAIAFDLLRHAHDTTELVVLDVDEAALGRLVERCGDDRLRPVTGDVKDRAGIFPLCEAADCIVSDAVSMKTERLMVSLNPVASGPNSQRSCLVPVSNYRQNFSNEYDILIVSSVLIDCQPFVRDSRILVCDEVGDFCLLLLSPQ